MGTRPGPDPQPIGSPAQADPLCDLGQDAGSEGGRVDGEGGAKGLEIEGMGRTHPLEPVEGLLPDVGLLPRTLPKEPDRVLEDGELKGLRAPP